MESEREYSYLGVDVGGTKIALSLGNERGSILASKRIPTSSFAGAKEALPCIIDLLHDLVQSHHLSLQEIDGVGLSLPGPLSCLEGKMLRPPNLPGWADLPILDYFRQALPLPVFMDNDGNGGALAEWLFGRARGKENLLYLTMSTGIGGGIIANGELLRGSSDVAGEIGHFVLDPKGPLCPCGQRGCFEAYCGGKNLALRLQEALRDEAVESSLLQEAGGKIEKVDVSALIKSVRKKDPYALEVWSEWIERVAQGVGIVLMTLNPEVLILGTIAGFAQEDLLGPLVAALPRYAWPEAWQKVSLFPSTLGNQIGELGSIAIAIQGLHRAHLVLER